MSADERRRALVQAAISVMTREGVARATTRAIAAEAGMPLGNFHYAFRSKQELMTMVLETIARRSRTEIDAAVLTTPSPGGPLPDVTDVVRAGLGAYLDHVVAHPGEHLVTYELVTTALREPDLHDVASRQYDYYLQQNQALLETAADLLGLEFTEPIEVVGELVFSTMDGLALLVLARGDHATAERVLDLLARSVAGMVRRR